jgi:hypothetical protein
MNLFCYPKMWLWSNYSYMVEYVDVVYLKANAFIQVYLERLRAFLDASSE